jgi:hypothetical protein
MSEDNYDPSWEISFDGDEEPSQEFSSHMLDAFAHAAGHGPHPGKYRKPRKPRRKAPAVAKERHKKPQESFAEFCKRLGIKRNTRRGGVEFCPATFLVKQLQSQRGKNDGS